MRDLRTGTGFDEEISPLRPSKRRDAEHEEVRHVPKRFRHEGEAAREAKSISQTSGGLSREEIARQLHRAAVIANRAAQDGRLGRLDSGQHIAPARRRGHGRRRAAKAANVDAGHVVSSLRPFPLGDNWNSHGPLCFRDMLEVRLRIDPAFWRSGFDLLFEQRMEHHRSGACLFHLTNILEFLRKRRS